MRQPRNYVPPADGIVKPEDRLPWMYHKTCYHKFGITDEDFTGYWRKKLQETASYYHPELSPDVAFAKRAFEYWEHGHIKIRDDIETSSRVPSEDWAGRKLEADKQLRNLLENEFRELKTVRCLKIYKVNQFQQAAEKIECARETEAWFEDRARNWTLEELEMAALHTGIQNMAASDEKAIEIS